MPDSLKDFAVEGVPTTIVIATDGHVTGRFAKLEPPARPTWRAPCAKRSELTFRGHEAGSFPRIRHRRYHRGLRVALGRVLELEQQRVVRNAVRLLLAAPELHHQVQRHRPLHRADVVELHAARLGALVADARRVRPVLHGQLVRRRRRSPRGLVLRDGHEEPHAVGRAGEARGDYCAVCTVAPETAAECAAGFYSAGGDGGTPGVGSSILDLSDSLATQLDTQCVAKNRRRLERARVPLVARNLRGANHRRGGHVACRVHDASRRG